jgi:hypothetical protein
MEAVVTKRNRRSPRIVARIPLEIHSSSESLEITTAVINLHGALILSPVLWAEGTTLTIDNKKTGLQICAQVVWAGNKEPTGLHKLGVEFEAASEDFWGSQYDPYAQEP